MRTSKEIVDKYIERKSKMRNNRIWSITAASGKNFCTTADLNKKEAKIVFEKLARDTSKNSLNDYIDLLIIRRNDKELMTMERVGKGEYTYHFDGKVTFDGAEAAEMLRAI